MALVEPLIPIELLYLYTPALRNKATAAAAAHFQAEAFLFSLAPKVLSNASQISVGTVGSQAPN
jgi:hypothetical protein